MALWITVLFVLLTIWPGVTNGGIRIILAMAAILVLAFNTAAIMAMLRHYRGDKLSFTGSISSISTRCACVAAECEDDRMAYRPPKQGMAGQIVDVVVLLVMTVGALYLPLYLGLAGAAKTPNPIDNPTW